MPEFSVSISEVARSLDRKRYEQFTRLRYEVHKRIKQEFAERMQSNPQPTETELALGVFIEQIEPQVRETLIEMNRKGYSTNSSGFYGEHGDKQFIDEYEDEIDIEMTETTPEGKHNIALFLFLTREKGFSTEEALFTIASEAVKEESKWIVSTVTAPTSHELHIHVKRNGEITYGKLGIIDEHSER